MPSLSSLWKVLAGALFLAVPVAYLAGVLTADSAVPPPRPTVVLASPVSGEGPTAIPDADDGSPNAGPRGTRGDRDDKGADDRGSKGEDRPRKVGSGPSPERGDEACDDDDDDDDDGVIVVRPCPEDLGDDDGDDDDRGDRSGDDD